MVTCARLLVPLRPVTTSGQRIGIPRLKGTLSERSKILFVCGRNQKRSPTAARIFQNDPRLAVRSAGVSPSSPHRISSADVRWADLVLAMERKHLDRIGALFPDAEFTGRHLGVPDEYEFMDADLIELLRGRVEEAIEAHGK